MVEEAKTLADPRPKLISVSNSCAHPATPFSSILYTRYTVLRFSSSAIRNPVSPCLLTTPSNTDRGRAYVISCAPSGVTSFGSFFPHHACSQGWHHLEVCKGKTATVAGDMALPHTDTVPSFCSDCGCGNIPLAKFKWYGWRSSKVRYDDEQ